MSDAPDQAPQTSDADRELEREIRNGREFSMAEALGRLAGPGGMKGGSPVPHLQQAQAEVEHLVRRHLQDRVGVLVDVLIREVGESRVLFEHQDEPRMALISHIRQVLDSDYLLTELVRMTDMEWGRVFGERPYFEMEGRPPHPDDPYTIASVRDMLNRFLATLPTTGG